MVNSCYLMSYKLSFCMCIRCSVPSSPGQLTVLPCRFVPYPTPVLGMTPPFIAHSCVSVLSCWAWLTQTHNRSDTQMEKPGQHHLSLWKLCSHSGSSDLSLLGLHFSSLCLVWFSCIFWKVWWTGTGAKLYLQWAGTTPNWGRDHTLPCVCTT